MKTITKFLTLVLSLFCVFGMMTPVYAIDGAFNAITEFNIMDASSKEVIYTLDDENYELEVGKNYRIEGQGVYLTDGFEPYQYFENQINNIDGITFLGNGGSDGGPNEDGTYGFGFAFEFVCTKQGVNGSLELLEMGKRNITTPNYVTVSNFDDVTVESGTIDLDCWPEVKWDIDSMDQTKYFSEELLESRDGGSTWNTLYKLEPQSGYDTGRVELTSKDSGRMYKLVCTYDGTELYNKTKTVTVVDKTSAAETTEGTPTTTTTCDEATIVKNVVAGNVLSDEQKVAVENGASVSIKTVASKIEPTTEDKSLVEAQLNSTNKIAMYLDLKVVASVTKNGTKFGDDVTVRETGTPVKFTIALDDSFINTKNTVDRTYQVVRIHNGVVDVLPATFNADSKTITFETDKFSTYAVMYTDTPKASKTPSTADNMNVALYGGVAVVSVLAIGFLFFFKKRNA